MYNYLYGNSIDPNNLWSNWKSLSQQQAPVFAKDDIKYYGPTGPTVNAQGDASDAGTAGRWDLANNPNNLNGSNFNFSFDNNDTAQPNGFTFGTKTGGKSGRDWQYQLQGDYYVPVTDLGFNTGSKWDTNGAQRQANQGLAMIAGGALGGALFGGGTAAGAGGGLSGTEAGVTAGTVGAGTSEAALAGGGGLAGAGAGAGVTAGTVGGTGAAAGGGGGFLGTGLFNGTGVMGSGLGALDIAKGAGAIYSTISNKNKASQLQDMYNRQRAQVQPYADRLNETYTNPDAYLKSPEYQAIQQTLRDKIMRQKAAGGTLSNNTDLDVALQRDAMTNLDKYRQGLSSTISSMQGNAAKYSPMAQKAIEGGNDAYAPLFAYAGAMSQKGQLDKTVKEISSFFGW